MPRWLNTGAHILTTAGGFVGGAVGNGMEAVGDGIETGEDISNHQYGKALLNGGETLLHGTEAVVDGMAGDWIF